MSKQPDKIRGEYQEIGELDQRRLDAEKARAAEASRARSAKRKTTTDPAEDSPGKATEKPQEASS